MKEHLKPFFLSLVLCDPWSGHKDEQVLLEASGRKDVDLKIIPPKTTKYAQPLDMYFFRQYKICAKRITDFIKLRSSNTQPKLHDRFFIMKVNTVIYNQLPVEACRPMLHMAECWLRCWWTCGHLHKCHWRGIQHCNYRMCSYDMWSPLLFFTMRFVVIHIALSISLKLLPCIYNWGIGCKNHISRFSGERSFAILMFFAYPPNIFFWEL